MGNLCKGCQAGKGQRSPFPSSSPSRASKPFELIHADLFGPTRVPTPSGATYGSSSEMIIVVPCSFMNWLTSQMSLSIKSLAKIAKSMGHAFLQLRTDNDRIYPVRKQQSRSTLKKESLISSQCPVLHNRMVLLKEPCGPCPKLPML